MKHKHSGNCWDTYLVYSCKECGHDNLCDVCHEHELPRGECDECERCQECDDEETD